MKSPTQEFFKLDEAANILKCEIEDILENWSIGKIYLCINFIPPQDVIVIDDAYLQYLDDHFGHFTQIGSIPSPGDRNKFNISLEMISGPFYLMPGAQMEQARPFVTENFLEAQMYKFDETKQNMINFTKILIPPQKFDELIIKNKKEPLDYRLGSFHFIICDPFEGYVYKTKHLRITNNELKRFSEINSLKNINIDGDKELLEGERDSLLLTIGALADLVASEHGDAFMSGGKPNKSRITETLIKHVGKVVPGLGSSSIQGRISKGLKLLDKAKKES